MSVKQNGCLSKGSDPFILFDTGDVSTVNEGYNCTIDIAIANGWLL